MKTFEDKLKLFQEKISEIYKQDSETILATHYVDRKKTFRINNLVDSNKSRAVEMLRTEGIEFEELKFRLSQLACLMNLMRQNT